MFILFIKYGCHCAYFERCLRFVRQIYVPNKTVRNSTKIWQTIRSLKLRHGRTDGPSLGYYYYYYYYYYSQITYSMEHSPSSEANRFQLVNKFPTFYGTQFITAFTRARHLSLFGASCIQSTPSYPTSCRSILILSSHLRLGLPSGLFLSDFTTKPLYAPLLCPIHATCSARLISSWSDHPKKCLVKNFTS